MANLICFSKSISSKVSENVSLYSFSFFIFSEEITEDKFGVISVTVDGIEQCDNKTEESNQASEERISTYEENVYEEIPNDDENDEEYQVINSTVHRKEEAGPLPGDKIRNLISFTDNSDEENTGGGGKWYEQDGLSIWIPNGNQNDETVLENNNEDNKRVLPPLNEEGEGEYQCVWIIDHCVSVWIIVSSGVGTVLLIFFILSIICCYRYKNQDRRPQSNAPPPVPYQFYDGQAVNITHMTHDKARTGPTVKDSFDYEYDTDDYMSQTNSRVSSVATTRY